MSVQRLIFKGLQMGFSRPCERQTDARSGGCHLPPPPFFFSSLILEVYKGI